MEQEFWFLSPSALIILLGVVCLAILGIVLLARNRHGKDLEEDELTIDDLIATHGEPTDLVVLDATRSNDPVAVVLVYPYFIVVDGKTVARDKISGITFHNASNPYLNSVYTLDIDTTIPGKAVIKVPIGSDARQAQEVTAQLADLLLSSRNSD